MDVSSGEEIDVCSHQRWMGTLLHLNFSLLAFDSETSLFVSLFFFWTLEAQEKKRIEEQGSPSESSGDFILA